MPPDINMLVNPGRGKIQWTMALVIFVVFHMGGMGTPLIDRDNQL